MKRVISLFLIAVLGISLTACTGSGASSVSSSQASSSGSAAVYHTITPQDAKAKLASGDPVILLDVRTTAEFVAQRIKGSILIPDTDIEKEAAVKLPDKNAYIIVYCRTGHRSGLASKALVAMGYTNVYDLGGIQSWPYDTVSGS